MQASIEIQGAASTSSRPPSLSAPRERPPVRDLTAKKVLFAEAMREGCTKAEASRRAGINVNTGGRWAKVLDLKKSDMPQKDALVEDLFKSYRDARPATKAVIAKRICDMLGWDARKQADEGDKVAAAPLRDLVITWVNERANRVRNASGKPAHLEEVSPTQSGTESRPITSVMSPESGASGAQPDGGGSPQASDVGGVRSDSETAAKIPDSGAATDSATAASTPRDVMEAPVT